MSQEVTVKEESGVAVIRQTAVEKVMKKRQCALFQKQEYYVGKICERFAESFCLLFVRNYEIAPREVLELSDDELREIARLFYKRSRKWAVAFYLFCASVPIVGWLGFFAAGITPNRKTGSDFTSVEFHFCFRFLRKNFGEKFFPASQVRAAMARDWRV